MGENLTFLDDIVPDAPDITSELIVECEESGDFRPILFEYYRFIAQLSVTCSCIQFDSPAWTGKSRKTWEVVVGSFTRCHRLMAANLEYFQHDRYGEATQILDRCLFETAVKIIWLVSDPTEDRTRRFLEGSLRPDRELEQRIEKNIKDRSDQVLVIENRMLRSIARHRNLAGFGAVDPDTFRRMPDLSVILKDIGEDRAAYVSIGKIGSNHVHGNWGSLLSAYLKVDGNGEIEPRHEQLPSIVDQYVLLPLYIISSQKAFLLNCFEEGEFRDYLLHIFDQTQSELLGFNRQSVGTDFDVA